MNIFRNLPIKRKVILVIMISSMTTLLMASSAVFVFQWIYARKIIESELLTHAEVMAANSTAAISFRDAQAATEILAALKAEPHILEASLYLPDHTRLAHYGLLEKSADMPPGPAPQGLHYEGSDLVLYQPVQLEGKHLGTFYLRCDFAAMQREFTTPYLTILAFTLIASFVLVLILSSMLQHLISGPVLRLAATAKAVAERKDYSVRADFESRDELGMLTHAFNHMLSHIQADDAVLRTINHDMEKEIAERKLAQSQLEDLHRQLMDSSRRAGMAEVATGVIHNVGNVMNSANVSSTLAAELVEKSEVANLVKVAALLREHQGDLAAFLADDPKGKHIPVYLVALADHLGGEYAALSQELGTLRKSIDHVNEIVAMQQNYASTAGVSERVRLDELVEDALRMNTSAFERHHVRVVRKFDNVPPIMVDKHKVLQILINLIRNGKYALDDGSRSDKQLTVRIRQNGNRRIKLEVEDNGVGIPAENLIKIFSHGFSTRRDGHGFGLHSGSLAAKEMGGTLAAQSPGPGQGATFILELPLEPERRNI